MRFETLAVHAGGEADRETGAVAPPIHLSTTFLHGPESEPLHGWLYQREGNPTQDRLEAGARRDRGRRLRRRSPSPPAWRPLRRSCSRSPPARASSSIATSTRACASWRSTSCRAGGWSRSSPTSPTPAPSAAALRARPGARLGRDPDQPAARDPRSRPARDRGARRQAPPRSSTGRSRRPPCSGRSPSAPTSCCTRRRSTWAATATSSAGRWSSPAPTALAETRRQGPSPPRRHRQPVQLLARPARAAVARLSRGTPLGERFGPRRGTFWPPGTLPGALSRSSHPPWTRGRGAPDDRLRRHAVPAGRRRTGGGGRRGIAPASSSPTRPASAARRAWSSTAPRATGRGRRRQTTCCACRSASSIRTTSSPTSCRRSTPRYRAERAAERARRQPQARNSPRG